MLAFLGRHFHAQGSREAKNTVEVENGLAKGTEHNASRSCLLQITSHLDTQQRTHHLSLNQDHHEHSWYAGIDTECSHITSHRQQS